MNSYYHAFIIGFNFWMVVWGVGIVVMVIVGLQQYYATASSRKVIQRFETKFSGIVAGVFSLIIAVMMMSESTDGLIQYMDNTIGAEADPTWSVIMLPVLVLAIALIIWISLFAIGYITGLAKAGSLYLWIERTEAIEAAAERKLERRRSVTQQRATRPSYRR